MGPGFPLPPFTRLRVPEILSPGGSGAPPYIPTVINPQTVIFTTKAFESNGGFTVPSDWRCRPDLPLNGRAFNCIEVDCKYIAVASHGPNGIVVPQQFLLNPTPIDWKPTLTGDPPGVFGRYQKSVQYTPDPMGFSTATMPDSQIYRLYGIPAFHSFCIDCTIDLTPTQVQGLGEPILFMRVWYEENVHLRG